MFRCWLRAIIYAYVIYVCSTRTFQEIRNYPPVPTIITSNFFNPFSIPIPSYLTSVMHTKYRKPRLQLSRQPTQPADDPSWSKPKPKFGQPTPIPPRNEPPLCALANIDVTSVTPRSSEFSASDVKWPKLAVETLTIEQVKNVIVEDRYPASLEKNTSGHLKVSYSFTGSFILKMKSQVNGIETPESTGTIQMCMKGLKREQPHSDQENDADESEVQ
jgi:hypothetical protein